MAGRVTQVVAEVLRYGKPHGRVTQVAVEVLRYGKPHGRVTQVVLEVLREPEQFDESRRKRLFLDPPAFLSTTLTDFPVRIHLGTEFTDVFNDIPDADYQKIKISTDLAGTSELYVEVEKWDATNKNAILWVKRTLVPGTRQFLYFWWKGPANTSYVGVPGSTPAQSVWNSNFKVVYHMYKRTTNIYDTDAIADSTSNANHATGATLDADDYIDGENGKQIRLNNTGGTDEYFDSKANGLDPTAAFTLEFRLKFRAYEKDWTCRRLCAIQSGSGTGRDLFYGMSQGGPLVPWSYLGGAERQGGRFFLKGVMQSHHVVMTYTGNPSGSIEYWIDGVKSTRSITGVTAEAATGVFNFMSGLSSHNNPWFGYVDEIRVSQTKRSDDWIKATNRSFTEEWVVLDTEFLTSTTYPPEPTTTTAPPEEPPMEWGDPQEVWNVDDAIGGNWQDSSTGSDRNYRIELDVSDLLAPPGAPPYQVRVTLRAHSAQPTVITGCSIGRRDASTDDYVTGKFSRVTFDGGSNGCTISAGQTKVSDWVTLDYDELYDHFVHVYVDANPTSYFVFMTGGAGYRRAYSTDDTMAEDISGYDAQTDHYFVEKVEARGQVEASTTTAEPPVEYPLSLTITNPGAESDTAGWTNETGTLTVKTTTPSPWEGSKYFYGGDNAALKAYQELDLLAQGADSYDLDAGTHAFYIEWWQSAASSQASENDDLGWVSLRFKNASRTVLLEVSSLPWQPPNGAGQFWFPRWFQWEIPAGTRYVDVVIEGLREYGTSLDAYFDSLAAQIIELSNTKWVDNFSAYTVGQVPTTSQWNKVLTIGGVWGRAGDWQVEAISDPSYGGKGLRESDNNAEYNFVPAGLDVEDFEVLVKYELDSISEDGPAVQFMQQPYDSAYTHTQFSYGQAAAAWPLQHYRKGVSEDSINLFSGTVSPVPASWWIRMRRVERRLWIRKWLADGTAEPTSWGYESWHTDVSEYTAEWQFPGPFPGGVGMQKWATSGPVDVFSLCKGLGTASYPSADAAIPTRLSQYQLQTLRAPDPTTVPVRLSQYQVQVLRQQALLYATNFREPDYTLGSPPPDWTERWDTAVMAWTIEAGVGTSIRKRILHGVYSGPADLNAMSWNDIGSMADVEILTRLKVAAGGTYTGNVVRGAGSDGSESGYMLCLDEANDRIGLFKVVSGTLTQIGSYVSKTIDADTWYFLRFRVIGTSLKGRFWVADGDTEEPGTWDFDTTDSSVTAAGWAGVVANDVNADFDYFGVGTNGSTPLVPEIGMQRGVVMIVVT